jgi:hypothetical protein
MGIVIVVEPVETVDNDRRSIDMGVSTASYPDIVLPPIKRTITLVERCGKTYPQGFTRNTGF